MGYFQVRYAFRVVNYDLRGFIRLATEVVNVNDCPRMSKSLDDTSELLRGP